MKKTFICYITALLVLCIDSYAYEQYPERIVSLGPEITEKIYELGAGDRIIANTVYCKRPAAAASKIKIGTVVKVDIEKIIALKPDLVLATSLSQAEQIEKMEKLGLNVIIINQPAGYLDFCNKFITLGRIIGEEKTARKAIEITDETVRHIRKTNAQYPKQKVFVQIGIKPLFSAGKNSFIHDMIEFSGGINIASEAGSGIYSREQVVKDNPDVIIIADMGINGRGEKTAWEKFKSINAVKDDRIHIIDSYSICSPTPAGVSGILKELSRIMHPEIESIE